MIWFGSSAGVALSNMWPERSRLGRDGDAAPIGWTIALGYVIGFFAMLADHRLSPRRALASGASRRRLSRYIIAPRLSSSCWSEKIEV